MIFPKKVINRKNPKPVNIITDRLRVAFLLFLTFREVTQMFLPMGVFNRKTYCPPKVKRTPASMSKRNGWIVRRERGCRSDSK